MVIFKNILGEVVAEIVENSKSVDAENFATYWNCKANATNKICEIDMNNGCIIFLGRSAVDDGKLASPINN